MIPRSITLCLFLCLSASICYGQKSSHRRIQRIIDQAVAERLAGVVIYIHRTGQAEWTGCSGFADLEKGQRMAKDNIFSLGSIGKMYAAVAAMKLVEEGRFGLDDRIQKYLPDEITYQLPNGDEITIRHLLGHTSGLVNYEADPDLNALYISGRLKLDTLSHLNALKRYVFGKPALNKPGVTFHYSSTNFMVLAMIMDSVTSHGHTEYIRDMISKNGFTHTFYRQTPTESLVQHYGDLNRDGQRENVSLQTIETTNWFMGDDGIYASAGDAAHFLELLMNGKILDEESLKAMTAWNDPKKPDYGLGLMADKGFPYKFLMGHSGRGIGTTTDLYYFPKQKMTVGIFCNTGIRSASPEFKKAYLKMRSRIVKKLFIL